MVPPAVLATVRPISAAATPRRPPRAGEIRRAFAHHIFAGPSRMVWAVLSGGGLLPDAVGEDYPFHELGQQRRTAQRSSTRSRRHRRWPTLNRNHKLSRLAATSTTSARSPGSCRPKAISSFFPLAVVSSSTRRHRRPRSRHITLIPYGVMALTPYGAIALTPRGHMHGVDLLGHPRISNRPVDEARDVVLEARDGNWVIVRWSLEAAHLPAQLEDLVPGVHE